ncbi:MAG: reverse transcriptase family protein [Acidobacteriota bacterium]
MNYVIELLITHHSLLITTVMQQPRTQEEILAAARQSSREAVILEEMIRLGFWPAQGVMPEDPADEIRRRGELEGELRKLRGEFRKLHNEAHLLKEARKRRLEESRRKQKENKERRERERQERATAWQAKKASAIVYLGDGVSAGLNHVTCDEARLATYGLPRLTDAAEIAASIGITVNELRFLSFSRKTSTVSHYVRFKLPKKPSGERLISAPMPRLKKVQHWILENLLAKVELHDAAHGFRSERSIVSNAAPHVGAEVVINLDLKDFFPSISYKRVKGVFRALGYSEAAATIFALLCTEPQVEEVVLDGKTYFIATGERHLPQGAPTSPAITNILCRRLDKRLLKMATGAGFKYTRYADDLTFSTSGESKKNICNVLRRVESIVAHEGLTIHPDKTRVLRRSRQQEVTGVVVNEKTNVSKKELKRFRALLFQIEKDGLAGKRWSNSSDVLASMMGFANFVFMVNPEKGAELQARVRALMAKHHWQAPKFERQAQVQQERLATSEPEVINKPAEKSKPKNWWKLW